MAEAETEEAVEDSVETVVVAVDSAETAVVAVDSVETVAAAVDSKVDAVETEEVVDEDLPVDVDPLVEDAVAEE